MKKFSKYLMSASVFMLVGVGVALAAECEGETGVCKLICSLGDVIGTLRTLAFLGAAFVLMDWAWGFIKAGDVKKDDLKDKGIGMFVGFFLLFAVGMVLQFVGSDKGKEYLGCVEKYLS